MKNSTIEISGVFTVGGASCPFPLSLHPPRGAPRGKIRNRFGVSNELPLISIHDNKQNRAVKYTGGAAAARRDIRVGRRGKKAPTAGTLRGLLAPEL